MSLALIRFSLYGAVGWCTEIIFTAVVDSVGAICAGRPLNPKLPGQTYVWMFFAYGAGCLLFEAVHRWLGGRRWPWLARGIAYAAGSFAFEYAFGWAIRELTGRAPWDYGGARWNVEGLIRLDYAGWWGAFGLGLERVERAVKTMAVALHASGAQEDVDAVRT
jgi:hypothetical protein